MNATATAVLPKPSFNPWPYALIAFFITLVSIIGGFVTWSLRQDMELVGADYYDQEMRFQQRINSVNRTRPLGDQVVIAYEANSIHVTVPKEHAAQKISGTIQLYRPSNARLDRQLNLDPDPAGQQFVAAKDLEPGLWKVRVAWKFQDEEFFRDTTVIVPPSAR